MLDKFKLHLRASGQSVTAPRLAIFEFLQDHDPTTITAVIDRHTATIDRASTYRTLALFKSLGIIQDIVAGGQRMIELTDTFDAHHHHLTCLRCGSITAIEDPAIEHQLDELARAHGYKPTSHQIEVSGLCAACRPNVTQ
jgi:Fur family ferric uptake transcriptional regulator